jgi:translocation and assembly module TamA
VPESAAGAFSLKEGAPAVAATVLAAGTRLLTVLQEQGYAFAKVDPPVAYEDQTLPLLDVTFHVEAGERVNVGEIRLDGLERMHEKRVRRRLTLHTGQRFSPSAIEAARRDLLSLGPFGAVTVQVGQAVDATGGVPVTFVLRERKRHAVTLNAAFSSDLGGSGGVTWTDRNVFGNAEQLTVNASIINLGGSDTTGVGYDTGAKFVVPDVGHRDQSLQVAVGAIKQYLQAYDQQAVTMGLTLSRKLSSVFTVSGGVTTSVETVVQNLETLHYTLVGLPISVGYDSTHLGSPLDDPTHGMRDSLSVTPTQSLGHPDSTFIIAQIKLASYFDLHALGLADPGRSVLAVRALAGQAQGAGGYSSLPPDQRFYAGGSGTIRGYSYQLVGPVFTTPELTNTGARVLSSNGTPVLVNTQIPTGGTSIAAGSLEFRQRIGASWGAALFLDGGNVGSNSRKLPTDFKFGAGVGLRYYTPIGPIRLDFAVPLSQVAGVDEGAFQVYIGLGQAF